MPNTKQDWLMFFRDQAEQDKSIVVRMQKDYKSQASEINKRIKAYRDAVISEKESRSTRSPLQNNQQLLHDILMITYTSNIVMLESRNSVWEYEYMAFARRIGELWEPFCKLAFDFPIKALNIIDPPNFAEVQSGIQRRALAYINALSISNEEKRELKTHFSIPWSLVDSGGIKLGLDLHFEQDGIHYNCDFKSGFSSNEKGNTNRLLLVASIYHSLSDQEKTLLFVRQNEDENNHYLLTLKNSPYWDVYCGNDCYQAMKSFTGFDMRSWLDNNVDWEGDISPEFREHLKRNDLLKYLTW